MGEVTPLSPTLCAETSGLLGSDPEALARVERGREGAEEAWARGVRVSRHPEGPPAAEKRPKDLLYLS